jgi:hypothetical protein
MIIVALAFSALPSMKPHIACLNICRDSPASKFDLALDQRVGAFGEMHRFAGDGHRVVADALQRDVGVNHRRHQTQMPGARQVHADESVAHLVQLAVFRVDPLIAQDGRVGQLVVTAQQGAHRGAEGLVDALGQQGRLLFDQ